MYDLVYGIKALLLGTLHPKYVQQLYKVWNLK